MSDGSWNNGPQYPPPGGTPPTPPTPPVPPAGGGWQAPPPMAPQPAPPPPYQAPVVAPPTMQTPITPSPGVPGPSTPGGGKKKGLLIGGGILAAAAIAVGAVVVMGGDDDASTTGASTTVATSVSTSQDVSTTAGPTTTAGSTSVPAADIDTISHSVVQILAAQADDTVIWTGSGTIVSTDGLILTNAHVVENSGDPVFYDKLIVSLTDRADSSPVPTYNAEVVAFDAALDLAVIKVTADLDGNPVTDVNLPALPVGDSDQIGLGDNLRILGFPGIGGDTITFTQGAVSGFTAEAGVGERAWVKTDATIAGGNSGGTAVNDAGQLVAIPTQASATSDGDITDCRVVQDTNGDNIIDENDSCIPIGGFINGLRPVNLALPLIEQGRSGEVVPTVPTDPGGGEVNLDDVYLGPIFFATDVNVDDNSPIGPTEILPSGSSRVCAFFDYEGMADGAAWDVVWNIDGTLNEDFSMFDQEWTGGEFGTNWWVCAGNGSDPLPEGVYELVLYVEGQIISSDVVYVGNYAPVSINVINNSASEVCYLQMSPPSAQAWGGDELGPEQTILAGSSTVITEVGGVYDVLASDCDYNVVSEQYDVDLSAGGDLIIA